MPAFWRWSADSPVYHCPLHGTSWNRNLPYYRSYPYRYSVKKPSCPSLDWKRWRIPERENRSALFLLRLSVCRWKLCRQELLQSFRSVNIARRLLRARHSPNCNLFSTGLTSWGSIRCRHPKPFYKESSLRCLCSELHRLKIIRPIRLFGRLSTTAIVNRTDSD